MSETLEEFIRDLYRGVLRREPEAGVVRHHLERIGGEPSFGQAVRLLKDFKDSEEFRSRALRSLSPNSLNLDAVDVVSVGSHCIVSQTLKLAGKKRWSGPFDWIFSNVDIATHCIKDNFYTFLNRSCHRSGIEGGTTSKGAHSIYSSRFGLPIIFNHHDIEADADYAYYQRCVSRFVALSRSCTPTVLVCLTTNVTLAQFERMCEAISKYSSSALLMIRAVPNTGTSFGFSNEREIGRNVLVNFRMFDAMGSLAFENSIDEAIFHHIVDAMRSTMLAKVHYFREK